MQHRILIVEDEIFVAMDVENAMLDMGMDVVGIAADLETALKLGPDADLALVDVNLRDGRTGDKVGHELANRFGVTVIFMTANPDQLGEGIHGTVGVLTKPCSPEAMRAAVHYAIHRRDNPDLMPPGQFKLFNQLRG